MESPYKHLSPEEKSREFNRLRNNYYRMSATNPTKMEILEKELEIDGILQEVKERAIRTHYALHPPSPLNAAEKITVKIPEEFKQSINDYRAELQALYILHQKQLDDQRAVAPKKYTPTPAVEIIVEGF